MQERLPGRGAMSVPPRGRLSTAIEAESIAPEVTPQYQYCAVHRIVCTTQATDWMYTPGYATLRR